ncbi:DUF4149 domain-containing protein [Limnohabitans sp. B9-3]|uniref:DUF4149 domain-containing protein n=1 Tax=Limnohabitans sp. B9-3 TaxID=1100707 RepID=UPI000C1E9E42|nr:DUF4149 domain-containing protein [Limnohabitans sp. B9-3]PIT77603.1 hypothetical protein B9Z42_03845 [Limnohabitans sp. B9-3]
MARLQVFLAALWWGSLVAVGFVVVPLLFVHLETPVIAGRMAAKLFTAQSWLSVACGLLLLLAARREAQDEPYSPSVWVMGGILLALLLELAVAPHIVARENLWLWHNVGTAFYLLQSACAAKVMWQLSASKA